jgi:hypothetical protein
MTSLEENHPDKYQPGAGYEETMTNLHKDFNPKEHELHDIIRAYTQYSMRTVNLEMSEWLKSDQLFKTAVVDSSRKRQLADNLVALEMHLLLWHAKYEAWIPNQPEHALVYMADEEEHGLGFPKDRKHIPPGETISVRVDGVDKDVTKVLKELRTKWKPLFGRT